MNSEIDAARRDRRSTAVTVGILVVFLTVIAAPILAIAGTSLADDRSTIDAYNAAPICPALASPDASCKRLTEYRISSEFGEAGHDAVYYLYLTDSSGAQIRVQLPSATGVWPDADGQAVTVSSWRGTPVSVSDGRNVSELIGSPVHTGDGAYTVFVLVAAVYLYLVAVVLIRRAVGLLLLVPTATLIAGIALHGWIVGGPWAHDFLLFVAGAPVVLFLIALIPQRRSARRKRVG